MAELPGDMRRRHRFACHCQSDRLTLKELMCLPPVRRQPQTAAFSTTRILWFCLLLGLCSGAGAQGPKPDAASPRDARLSWWREGRFGLFIHWGPVSLKGTEISWSRANSNPRCPNKGEIPVAVYDQLYRDFNPTNFAASEWVNLAQSAGMKYMVLTVKHCDGFLLWHSQASDYNISATPFRRDICRELADAAHRRRMKIGWYFSPMDWRDPDFRTERNDRFLARMQLEVQEVLSRYGRINLLWFDWDGREPRYDQSDTYRLVRSLQPNIIINNRLDLGETNSNRQILSPEADYYTPEQELGSYDDQRPWETCLTLGTQWAWKPNDQIKSTGEVVKTLARCTGGDGNLLLNVGPMPDGRIELRQVEVLRGVGAWLRKFGESIYKTRMGVRTKFFHILVLSALAAGGGKPSAWKYPCQDGWLSIPASWLFPGAGARPWPPFAGRSCGGLSDP